MVKICNDSYPQDSQYNSYFQKYKFPLSDFQKYAIEAIIKGQHALVTAHTGSGKTLPAEFAIEYFVENSNTKKFVPTFLIETNNKNIEISELLNGFKLVTNYLEKNILIPNNINQPIQRTDFINLLK